jgi:hypothetical protein
VSRIRPGSGLHSGHETANTPLPSSDIGGKF